MVEIFLLARHELPAIRAITARATTPSPAERYELVASFYESWRQVVMRDFPSGRRLSLG